MFDQALAEVRRGAKRGHWMCLFPRIVGLGISEMANRDANGSLDEARTYWNHSLPVAHYWQIVGAIGGWSRLIRCACLALSVRRSCDRR